MKRLFLACLSALLSLATWAYDFEEGGIFYNILDDGDSVEVTYERVNYVTDSYTGEMSIPDSVTHDGKTYTVVGIGVMAFSSASITSIDLPNTVTYLGEAAFNYCWALTSIVLPNSLTSIGLGAIGSCQALKSLYVPKSITSMDDYAFAWCYGLTDVTLEEGLTLLGAGAFAYSTSLEEITIPSTLTYMGDEAFKGCEVLRAITLPEGLTYLGDETFYDCFELEEVVIPGSLTYVGEYAFGDCESLSSVTINEGVPYISNNMFNECGFKSIELPSTITSIGDRAFYSVYMTSMNIPDNVKYIGDYAFYKCMYMPILELPDGLEHIGSYAFQQYGDRSNSSFSVTIPKSVTYIGESVFKLCTLLKEAIVLANIETIDKYVFSDCTSLATVSIPKTVKNINDQAFYRCSKLVSFTSYNREAPICASNSFSNASRSSCTLYVPEGSEEMYGAVSPWSDFIIEGIEVEDDGNPDEEETKFVEEGIYYQYVDKDAMTVEVTYATTAFNYYEGSIDIPSSIVHNEKEYTIVGIGENAFRQSPNLTAVIIPESVTYFGNQVFYECSALQAIEFPSGISQISEAAFYDCTALTELTIPATITTIDDSAFYGCTGVKVLTLEDGEETLELGTHAFYGGTIETLYLGRNVSYSVDYSAYYPFYEAGGSTLKNIIFGEKVSSLTEHQFYKCTALEELTIPSWITNIEAYAFQYCTGLKTVTISDGVTKLGKDMFYGCTALTNVSLPEGLTNMGDYAFRDCTALEEVAIPSTVTSATATFQGCTRLSKVKLPEGVSAISNDMFYNCSALTEITLPSSIGNVGNYAFGGCTHLEKVTFMEGDNSYYMGMYAFSGCVRLNSILLPSNVRYIGSGGFNNCTGLKKVVFPNQTGNNSSPFEGCSSLEEVILCAQSQSLNSYIAANQFNGCTSLAKIYVLSDIAPNVANANAFTNVPTETCVVYVPIGSRESYIDEDSYWSLFANIVELSEPLPVTYCVGNVTSESAQINGLVAVGSIGVTEVGFEYWAEGNDTPTVIVISDSFTATSELHATLADLAYGMTYTYRVYAKTASETFYGDEVTFTLPIDGAKVFTLDASSITETTAVLNGRLVLPDDESAMEQGFEYWAEGSEAQSVAVSGNSLTYTLEDLTPETTYTYYAFATLASGSTIYGEEVEFTTLENTDTGITNVDANGIDGEDVEGYYTPDGRALSAPQKGVNIIRYNDGSVKKIYIK